MKGTISLTFNKGTDFNDIQKAIEQFLIQNQKIIESMQFYPYDKIKKEVKE